MIIDVGSRFIRVGLAGALLPITFEVRLTVSSPQIRQTSSVAIPFKLPPWYELSDVESETPERQNELQKQLELHYPQWAQISDQYHADLRRWDVLNESMWDKQAMILCLRNALNKLALPLKWMKIIMVSNSSQSNARTLWLADILLHSVLVKSVVLFPEPLLQCILADTVNGLIFDLRWLETSIVGVVDLREVCSDVFERRFCGASLHYAVLEEFLALNIPELNSIVLGEKSFPFIEAFIINSCYVRSKPEADGVDDDDAKKYAITKTISIPNSLRFSIIERIYFEGTMQQTAAELIKRAPIDIRMTLQDNIIITGGISQIPGFKNRLIQELQVAFPNLQTRRSLGSWTGVSLYLSMLLTRNNWDVLKPREINREELGNLILGNRYKVAKLDQYLFD